VLRIREEQAVTLLLAAVRRAAEQALDQDGSREVEVAHLDMLRQALTPVALRGDLTAARLLVRISAHRSLLLGLVAAQPAEPAEPDEEVSELDRIRAERERRRATQG
jgi:hypothetical protein